MHLRNIKRVDNTWRKKDVSTEAGITQNCEYSNISYNNITEYVMCACSKITPESKICVVQSLKTHLTISNTQILPSLQWLQAFCERADSDWEEEVTHPLFGICYMFSQAHLLWKAIMQATHCIWDTATVFQSLEKGKCSSHTPAQWVKKKKKKKLCNE